MEIERNNTVASTGQPPSHARTLYGLVACDAHGTVLRSLSAPHITYAFGTRINQAGWAEAVSEVLLDCRFLLLSIVAWFPHILNYNAGWSVGAVYHATGRCL